jgi:hypothetical protein
VGRRLADLLGHLNADAPFRTTVGTVTAPFVSWFTAVLLAAELAKASAGIPLVERRVECDLRTLPSGVVRRLPSDPTGRCLCSAPARRRLAHRLYHP